jgi:hypothetical protein
MLFGEQFTQFRVEMFAQKHDATPPQFDWLKNALP